MHSGNRTVPRQLFARAPDAKNRITKFRHVTSILQMRVNIASGDALSVKNDLRMFTAEAALNEISEFF